jgi:8-oxo-dGTP pyrophosphatase MutT (NUDIX family)
MASYEIALVLLVDPSGAVLLQHRDEHAPASPNQWSLPGGRIEPGETPQEAARRELLEEAGLTAGELNPLWTGPRPYEEGFPHTVSVHVFRGTTDARQDDVVLGEGQAMVFVPCDEVLDRELAVASALVLPLHLDDTRRQDPADTRNDQASGLAVVGGAHDVAAEMDDDRKVAVVRTEVRHEDRSLVHDEPFAPVRVDQSYLEPSRPVPLGPGDGLTPQQRPVIVHPAIMYG